MAVRLVSSAAGEQAGLPSAQLPGHPFHAVAAAPWTAYVATARAGHFRDGVWICLRCGVSDAAGGHAVAEMLGLVVGNRADGSTGQAVWCDDAR